MKRARRGWFAWLALLLLACSEDRPPPSPARFDQPNRVEFVCVQDGKPVLLDHCKNDIAGNDLALHALVTQSARGEIAALNLDTQQVLDSRREIPGFTFVPVGEMPIALVVPPRHPELAYVADYGSRDIRVLDTSALVSPQPGDPVRRTLRLALDATSALVVLQPDESAADRDDLRVIAPRDMVLAPDESALIVSAPDVARVIYLPIDRCREAAADCTPGMIDESRIAVVPLQGSIDRALSSEPEPFEPSVYEQLCSFEGDTAPEIAAPPELPDSAWMNLPRPGALAVDGDCPDEGECTPRVLVADEALPLIHALDLDALAAGADPAGAVLEPLRSGAPTLGLVVTPWVPATLGSGETHYVYAIDATDGSVMALERGQVLNVNNGISGRRDRIGFLTDAGATALAVVTPGFDVEAGAQQWIDPGLCPDDVVEDPALLRGVFLAVAHTDGNVRIVDVHDMELWAPAGEACRRCPRTDPPMPVLARHQPRLARNFLSTDADDTQESGPVSEPRFYAGGLPFNLRADGTTGNPLVPGLDCIACDPGLLRAFPPTGSDAADDTGGRADADAGTDGEQEGAGCVGADAPALVCGSSDPWSGGGEQWSVTYEGPIPGTTGGRGRFIPEGSPDSMTGALEFAAEIDFCAAGVLGAEDIAESYGDQSCEPAIDPDDPDDITGDQLVLRSNLPSPELVESDDPRVADRCKIVRDALNADDAKPLGFEIRRAYRDRLVLRTALVHTVEGVARFEELLPCLDRGSLAFDIRTTRQYTVQGSLSGFEHQVGANAAGRCAVRSGADPLRQGRARPGCTFRNRAIEFRLHRPQNGELPPEPGTALLASVATQAGKLSVNVASAGFGSVNVVAVQMRYDPISAALYLVDVHGRGLIPISLQQALPVFASGSFN